MGLTLQGNVVLVDHSHNRLLNTSVKSNPVIHTIGDLKVFAIFKREKSPRHMKQDGGDNCHLLYALKNKDGLITTISSIKSLLPNFKQIIQKLPADYDLVVPMPSKHMVTAIVAKRLALLAQTPIDDSVFQKITIEQARATLSSLDLPSPEKRAIDFRLKKQSDGFSLKDIPPKYRHLFSPIELQHTPGEEVGKILLVDDLLATGTTLVTAKNTLQAKLPNTEIEAVCLFGAVQKI